MRYHKSHLIRRLILETSADNEKEENMVELLRVRSVFEKIIISHEKKSTKTHLIKLCTKGRVMKRQQINTNKKTDYVKGEEYPKCIPLH